MNFISPQKLLGAITQITHDPKEQRQLIEQFEYEWAMAVKKWREKHDAQEATKLSKKISLSK